MKKGKCLSKRLYRGNPLNIVFILIAIFLNVTTVHAVNADNDDFYDNIVRQDDVAMRIFQSYVEDIPATALIDNAIRGMMQILDPHSVYFEPKQYEQLVVDTEGKFGGLGILISIREQVPTVLSPYNGTPASRAGIQSGDQIVKIEGKSTTGMTMENAIKMMRGEPGTGITITIRRKGEENDRDYTIVREIIRIKAVPFAGVFQNDIGYVQLAHFSEEAGTEVEKAIKELTAKKIKGLILDLRGNPGGLLPQAIEVAEKFLPRKALIVTTRGRTRVQNRDNYSGTRPVYPVDMPLVVLVNSMSASASEIVAGAIQDYDRGVIVGDTTFGKGSVQSVIPLDNTHHIKLTTAFYYTPSGRCINSPGNAPRITADKAETDSVKENEPENGIIKVMNRPGIDTAAYLTKNGRVVRGGGGIIPDIPVEQKTPHMTLRMLLGKDAFFQFANAEYPILKKRHIKIDAEFAVDESIITSFYRFLDSIQFDFQSLAQTRFSEFTLSAGLKDTVDSVGVSVDLLPEVPRWKENEKRLMQKYAAKMDSMLRDESRRELEESEKEIKKYIRQAFLTREFGQDTEIYYREYLSDDPQFEAARELLTDNERYGALLQPAISAAAAVDIIPAEDTGTENN